MTDIKHEVTLQLSWGLYSQRPSMELNFTAVNNGVPVRLDSIKVMNRIHWGESMFYWPATGRIQSSQIV